jgi:hypothetical protein
MPSGSTEMNTLTKEKVVDEKNQRRLLLRWWLKSVSLSSSLSSWVGKKEKSEPGRASAKYKGLDMRF